MKTLSETINPHFAKCLKDGIHDSPKGSKYVAVHVSSWHMSIFWEAYDDLRKVEEAIAYPLIDPMCYSCVKLVWAVEDEELVFYNAMGFVESAHEFWENHKDDESYKPKIVSEGKPYVRGPREKDDHLCQADPGETKCYFCGEPIPDLQSNKLL